MSCKLCIFLTQLLQNLIFCMPDLKKLIGNPINYFKPEIRYKHLFSEYSSSIFHAYERDLEPVYHWANKQMWYKTGAGIENAPCRRQCVVSHSSLLSHFLHFLKAIFLIWSCGTCVSTKSYGITPILVFDNVFRRRFLPTRAWYALLSPSFSIPFQDTRLRAICSGSLIDEVLPVSGCRCLAQEIVIIIED
jgi:hypothetical protein